MGKSIINNPYTLGIDIGGTHTDLVIVCNVTQKIVASSKTITTKPLEKALQKGIENLQPQHFEKLQKLSSILIGTTQATNSLIEHKNLFKVGVIRIASKCSSYLPPCYKWPLAGRNNLYAGYHLIDGGFECDRREIRPFRDKQAEEALKKSS